MDFFPFKEKDESEAIPHSTLDVDYLSHTNCLICNSGYENCALRGLKSTHVPEEPNVYSNS